MAPASRLSRLAGRRLARFFAGAGAGTPPAPAAEDGGATFGGAFFQVARGVGAGILSGETGCDMSVLNREERQIEPGRRNWPSLAPGLLVLALGLALALEGCATQKPALAPPSPLEGVDVTAELKKSVAGWNAGNLDAFMAVYAEGATFARPDGFIRGKAAIRELYAPAFAPGVDRDLLVLERLETQPISADAVLVKGIYSNMRQGKVTRRGTTTLLMRLIGGQWRIVHDHSS